MFTDLSVFCNKPIPSHSQCPESGRNQKHDMLSSNAGNQNTNNKAYTYLHRIEANLLCIPPRSSFYAICRYTKVAVKNFLLTFQTYWRWVSSISTRILNKLELPSCFALWWLAMFDDIFTRYYVKLQEFGVSYMSNEFYDKYSKSIQYQRLTVYWLSSICKFASLY